MRKTPDDTEMRGGGQAALPCRVAYTLNNHQPVICTIIGDQPLFFMDFEGDFDEDALFEDMESIEINLDALEDRIETVLSAHGAPPVAADAQAMNDFIEDTAYATIPSLHAPRGDIAALLAILDKSRLAQALLDCARTYNTRIECGGAAESAHYDRRANAIFINPALAETDQVLLLARELRCVWQHRNGALLHPLMFHPDQAVLINRAQAADLSVAMVRIAWELQLAGAPAPWARIENSSMADLARAFARESYIDFRTLNNGVACSAVFETWFLSERCRHEDRRLIRQMLADTAGYIFDADGPAQQVTAELILALGSMPFGKNYLAPYVQTVMTDGLFTEVRDRSNANFLWFIKFERSFRETEQALPSAERGLQSDEFQNPGTTPKRTRAEQETRLGKDNEKTADILPLPGLRAHAANLSRGEDGGHNNATAFERLRQQQDIRGDGAQIIDLSVHRHKR